MALLLKRIAENYAYAITELADKRTNDWFLIRSPVPIVFLLTCYMLFIFEVGPKFMKNRKPLNIDRILIAYNAVQVLVCGYIVIKLFPFMLKANYFCEEVDYSERTIYLAELGYIYFLTKVLDLLDTVFFVLRKKSNQVTFLHVYHHNLMVSYVWYGVKYVAGGQLVFVGFANSLVHVVMYFYYLLTAYNSEYKKSVWWKMHITQLQLLQFFMIGLWLFLPMLQPDCNFPKVLSMVLMPQVFIITLLFADFYYKTYIRKPQKAPVS